MKLTEKQFNALTGEETITEREETAQEKAEREAFIAKQDKLKAEDKARLEAKQLILNRLGITAEEAALLLS